MDDFSPASRSLAHRIVWVVAVLCLAFSIFEMIEFGWMLGTGRWSEYFRPIMGQNSLEQWLIFVSTYSSILAPTILLSGSIGLMLRKRWSLWVMIAWVVMEIVIYVTLALYALENGLHPRSAGIALPAPSLGTSQLMQLLLSAMNLFLLRAAFPMLVGWIIIQRDVRDLWTRPALRAFEVIPIDEGDV